MSDLDPDFSDLRALFINCTLERSPELSHTDGLVRISTAIMEKHGVAVDAVRAVDHDIATGVWPDMREHGWATDDWPAIFDKVLATDILVLAGPIWLGDNSSVMKKVHERLYGGSHLGTPIASSGGSTASRWPASRRRSTRRSAGTGHRSPASGSTT